MEKKTKKAESNTSYNFVFVLDKAKTIDDIYDSLLLQKMQRVMSDEEIGMIIDLVSDAVVETIKNSFDNMQSSANSVETKKKKKHWCKKIWKFITRKK